VTNLLRALKFLLPMKWHVVAVLAASLLFSAVQAGGILLLKEGVDSALQSAAGERGSAAARQELHIKVLGRAEAGQTRYVVDGKTVCADAGQLAEIIAQAATHPDEPEPGSADLIIKIGKPDKLGRIKYTLNGKSYRDCSELARAVEEIGPTGTDRIASSRDLWIIGGLLMLTALLRGLFSYIQAYLSSVISNRVTMNAQNQIVGHIISLPLSFFHGQRTGELISRLKVDAQALRKTVKLATDMIKEPITLIGAIGVVFYMNWKLALVGFVGFPLAIWPLIVLSRRMRKASRKSREKFADMANILVQVFGGIRLVRAYGRENTEHERFMKTNQAAFRQHIKASRARALSRPVVEVLSTLGLAVVVVVGGMMVVARTVEPSHIVAFLAALMSMYNPAKSLAKDNEEIQDVIPGAERFFHLADVPNEMPDARNALDAPRLSRAIEIRNVTFSYVPGKPVLRDINLRIGAGQTVALVGHTGAGKSTLADLVCRFYHPQEGTISIDGVDYRQVSQRSLLDQIALVPQEAFLFNCSIRDNILYGRPNATQEEVEAAARSAAIHDEILALPAGYDTMVGERGTKLSGGQRQRVSIARALLRNAPILVLDEATSALDSASERLVQEAVERLLEGRTTLVIAHRLSTIRNADLIVVMSDGRVEDAGSHDELMAKSQTYRRLWQMQSSAAPPPPEHAARTDSQHT